MAQETTITGSFIWTLEDVKIRQEVLSGRPVTISRKIIVYSTTGAIMVFAIALLLFVIDREAFRFFYEDPYSALVPLVILVVTFVVSFLVSRYFSNANLKKSFLQSPDSNKRVDVSISQDEIVMKVEGISETKWVWKVIKEVRQNPKGLCIFIAEKTGFWIPIRAFQSQADVDAVIELAKQLTPKFKVSA